MIKLIAKREKKLYNPKKYEYYNSNGDTYNNFIKLPTIPKRINFRKYYILKTQRSILINTILFNFTDYKKHFQIVFIMH